MIAPHPPETAPKDGRVIRGWFRCGRGARLVAVSRSPDRVAWVDLLGQPVPKDKVLEELR